MPAPEPVPAAAIEFTYGGTQMYGTNIKVSQSRGPVMTATVDQQGGQFADHRPSPLVDCTVSMTCYSTELPEDGPAALSCSALGVSGYAVLGKYDIEAKANEFIVSTTEFKMCADPST